MLHARQQVLLKKCAPAATPFRMALPGISGMMEADLLALHVVQVQRVIAGPGNNFRAVGSPAQTPDAKAALEAVLALLIHDVKVQRLVDVRDICLRLYCPARAQVDLRQ